MASLRVDIDRIGPDSARRADSDAITVEEPLEIRLSYTASGQRVEQSISVTMRTPGDDEELALGFLAGEAIVRRASDVRLVEHCEPPSPDKGIRNVIRVELADGIGVDAGGLLRHFYTTSSCGVCGKASLDAVRVQIQPRPPSAFSISTAALKSLPEALRARQTEFVRTGGLHATASFDAGGAIVRVREDVGRHNAFDKLAGSYLADGTLASHGILLSGRPASNSCRRPRSPVCRWSLRSVRRRASPWNWHRTRASRLRDSSNRTDSTSMRGPNGSFPDGTGSREFPTLTPCVSSR